MSEASEAYLLERLACVGYPFRDDWSPQVSEISVDSLIEWTRERLPSYSFRMVSNPEYQNFNVTARHECGWFIQRQNKSLKLALVKAVLRCFVNERKLEPGETIYE